MPLSVNVSLRRNANHDVRSTSYSINVTAELEPDLVNRPKELQKRNAGLYAQAALALDRQADAPVLSEPPPVPSWPTLPDRDEPPASSRLHRRKVANTRQLGYDGPPFASIHECREKSPLPAG